MRISVLLYFCTPLSEYPLRQSRGPRARFWRYGVGKRSSPSTQDPAILQINTMQLISISRIVPAIRISGLIARMDN
jgi:hypothetical protein